MLEEIYKEVSEELSVPIQTIARIHRHKITWLKQQMREFKNIQIIDTGFGNYKVLPKKLSKKVKELSDISTEFYSRRIGLYSSAIDRYKELKKLNRKTKKQCTN